MLEWCICLFVRFYTGKHKWIIIRFTGLTTVPNGCCHSQTRIPCGTSCFTGTLSFIIKSWSQTSVYKKYLTFSSIHATNVWCRETQPKWSATGTNLVQTAYLVLHEWTDYFDSQVYILRAISVSSLKSVLCFVSANYESRYSCFSFVSP